MFKQVRSLLALGLLSTGAALGSLAVSAYSQWIGHVGLIPTATYHKYFLVAGLSGSGRQELSHSLTLLSVLGFLVIAANLGQRVRSALRSDGFFRLSVGLPLASLSLLTSLVTLATLRLAGPYCPGGLPAWAEDAYGVVGLAFFAPFVWMLYQLRQASSLERPASLRRPAWNWAAALAIFGAPAWWAGHFLTPYVVFSLDSAAYAIFYPERNFKPVQRTYDETETVITLHPDMPPVVGRLGSLRGLNQRDLQRKELYFAWNTEAYLQDAASDPDLAYWEMGWLIHAAAFSAPSPAVSQTAQHFSDPHNYVVVTPSENSRLLAQAARRNNPAETDANCALTGKLEVNGCPLSAVRIRLARVKESPAGTYHGIASRLQTPGKQAGSPTYLMSREFYAVATPDAQGRFSFPHVDAGRYLLQVRLPGNFQVAGSTQVPVVNLSQGQALELGSLSIETR